jgi:nucleoside-diphosphate-sugar epimerase
MSDLKNYKNKTVVITGGLGFIGSNIAQKLVALGAKIILIDSFDSRYGANLANVAEVQNQIQIVKADIRNTDSISSLIEKADVVFHLAAQVSYIDSASIPFEDLELNAKTSLQILELCKTLNKKARVIFASSRLVLGKVTAHPIQENHIAEPLSLYGIHKLTSENYFRLYGKMHGLQTAVLRITNPYGERQQIKHSKYSLPGWFMRQLMEGKDITIFGDGGQLRDYIYATDIADAFVLTGLAENLNGEVYNCGLGKSSSFRQMCETLVKIIGKGKIQYVPWPANYEKVETGDVEVDNSKLRKLTGWHPTITLEQGLEKMVRYYTPRLALYTASAPQPQATF